MRTWHLGLGDPLNLTLAADARLSKTDYANDQIWQLTLRGGEPPAITLQSTFGLRANWIRLFPRLTRKGVTVSNPAEFSQSPLITTFFPNYLGTVFWPFTGIEIQAEYWIPSSQAISGRLEIRNHNVIKENLSFEWVGLLSPLDEGEGMSVINVENTQVLQGKTSSLYPVCLFNSKTQPSKGPFPALTFDVDLFPGNSRQFKWAAAVLEDPKRSFQEARKFLPLSWDAEAAHIELQNDSQWIDITTGDDDWDAAFAFAQKTAYSLFLSANENLPYPSFVLSRQPDDGFSRRGDGSDYSYLWDGQTGLDAYYISSFLLPGGAELVEGVLRNFISTQHENGEIEWKPGLNGKGTQRLAQPVLATLAWEIDQSKTDHTWLNEIYPSLYRFFQAWFSPQHDRDQDGFPEWDHPLQTGLEDNPLYDRWQPTSQGIDIASLECPSLAAFLYREAVSLTKIARQVGLEEDVPVFQARADALCQQVESSWNPDQQLYNYRDFATHLSSDGNVLYRLQDTPVSTLRRSFKSPQRLILHFQKHDPTTRALTVKVTGITLDGETVEEFPSRRWTWLNDRGGCSSQNAFSTIMRVEVDGVDPEDVLVISRADYLQEDISLLLPLWAGIPSPEHAAELVNHCLADRFLQPYGIPDYHFDPVGEQFGGLERVTPIWNHLIGEGLIRYGYRAQAVELVTRLMEACIPSLRSNFAFKQSYHPASGQPQGLPNHLRGLPPLGLFLQAAGIRRLGQDFVITQDFNGFPWPITVKYQGMTVTCMAEMTTITFANGEKIQVSSPGIHRVGLA
jgi:hypothetical protein